MRSSAGSRRESRLLQARVLRRLAGLLFYLVAGFGTVLSIVTAILVRDLHRRLAGGGDTAGADLALWFLLDELLPLTLLALIAAIWLAPPATWFAQPQAANEPARAVTARAKALAAMLTVGAIGTLGFVARQLTDAIVAAHRHHDVRALALLAPVARDLLILSPLVALAVALFLSARKLLRPTR